MAVHNALQLQDRQTPKYRLTLVLQWDVDPEDVAQIDEEERQHGLVGVPLDEPASHTHSGNDSNFESDFDAMMADAE